MPAHSVAIGFQGEPGAFSEEAILALFGNVTARGYADFDALVRAVESREIEYGLLPCENTIFGSIARSYDLLSAHPAVKIVDETTHRIVQCLTGTPDATLERIETVASHHVALEQCREFFARYPHLRAVPVADTAGAVREIVQAGDPRRAAIGPALAARRYGGTLLLEGIQDGIENVTRFFAISATAVPRRNLGRACLAFHLAHEPGSLHAALGVFAVHRTNLRNLVVRPRRDRPFEYTFYTEIDLPGDADLDELAQSVAHDAQILGRY